MTRTIEELNALRADLQAQRDEEHPDSRHRLFLGELLASVERQIDAAETRDEMRRQREEEFDRLSPRELAARVRRG